METKTDLRRRLQEQIEALDQIIAAGREAQAEARDAVTASEDDPERAAEAAARVEEQLREIAELQAVINRSLRKSARRSERKSPKQWARIIDEAERLSAEARRGGGDDVLSRAERLLEQAEDMDLPTEGSLEADDAHNVLNDLQELVDELREQARMPSRTAGWEDDVDKSSRRRSERKGSSPRRAPGAHLLYA